jgi:hypothetical protein
MARREGFRLRDAYGGQAGFRVQEEKGFSESKSFLAVHITCVKLKLINGSMICQNVH